ncbi:MAG: D-alanine--D-alanine ligase [Bacteroidota bacterium]
MKSWQLKLYRWTHWEYWPFTLVYYPMFPVWLYLSIRARSFFFFNAANPTMKNGGMAMESKMQIYDLIPPGKYPNTLFISKQDSFESAWNKVFSSRIPFPFIVKPDIGMKSFGVDKIKSKDEFRTYFLRMHDDFLVQNLIPYQNELGIFYVRMPDEEKGRITGMVSKKFLSVVGDGKSSILQLIKQNPRSQFQLKALQKKYGFKLNMVLDQGKEFILVPFGSHTRGAEFRDVTHLVNDELLETIDGVCSKVEGFHYGRLDVLYNSFEELCQGKNFSIIEINGAGGEPTHIYDPKHSIFYAWREIFKHWKLMNDVSIMNHKKGHSYLSFRDGRAMLKDSNTMEQQIKAI